MPNYTYKNRVTGDVQELSMTIADMLEYEESNSSIWQRMLSPTPTGDSVRLGVHKQPNGWNDIVKEIKKKNFGSNINHKNGEF